MLLWFRRALAGTLAKVLLVLMIVSFAFFGYETAFQANPQTDIVATVGSVDIPATRLMRAREQIQENYTRAFGGQALPDFFQQRIWDDALKLLVNDALITSAAEKWQMPIPEKRLVKILGNYPAFQNADKTFDPELFKSVLAKSGVTPQEVLDDVRVAEWQRYFRDAFLAAAVVPEPLVIATLQQDKETRSALIFTLPVVPMTTDVPDSTLKPWFQTRTDRYKTPEKRMFGYTTLGLTFTDAAIESYYKAHTDAFTPAPKRRVLQQFCPDQACVDQNKGLKSLDPKQSGVTDLGLVEAKDLLLVLRQVAFDLPLNTVSAPVKTDFGWTFLQVTEIQAPPAPPLKDIKPQVIEAMKTPESVEALYKQTNALETAVAETGSLEKASQSLKVPFEKTALVTQDAIPEVLKPLDKELWSLPPNGTSGLQEISPDHYVMATLIQVVPSQPMTFAEARAQVLRDYHTEQAQTLLKQKRDALKAKLKAMKPEERTAFLSDDDINVAQPIALSRARAMEAFQADVAEMMFGSAIGEIKDITSGAMAQIVIVTGIQRPDPKTLSGPEKEETRRRLKDAIAQDYYEAFLEDLKTLFPVTVHQDVFKRLKTNG
jgi:peptidyl-prolyl cis-trans isomerase D